MGLREVILAKTPISYWRLGETSGTTATDEQAVNHLTYTGVTLNQSSLIVNGDTNPSISLDGTATAYAMKTSFASFPSTNITVIGWFKPTGALKTSGLFTYGSSGGGADDFRIYHTSTAPQGQIRVTVNAVDFDATVNQSSMFIQPSISRMVAVTWRSSDGRVQVWIDGALISTGNIKTGYTFGTLGAVVLGQDQDSVGGGFQAGEAFAGQIDDVALFNTVLSNNDIADIYLASIASSEYPSLLSADSPINNTIVAVFNKPVIYADQIGLWSVSGLGMVSATPNSDFSKVTIVTTGMVAGTAYTLSASSTIGDGTLTIINTTAEFTGAQVKEDADSLAPQSDLVPFSIFSFFGDTGAILFGDASPIAIAIPIPGESATIRAQDVVVAPGSGLSYGDAFRQVAVGQVPVQVASINVTDSLGVHPA